MASQLIELQDGIQVEIDVPADQLRHISGGVTEQVSETMAQIRPVLLKACKPLAEVWDELSREMSIKEANVTIQLGFSASGNVFVAKGSANANLTVALKLAPKDG